MVDTPTPTAFAQRFQEMLEACALTRAEFCAFDGIGQANVTNWLKRGRVGQQSSARVRQITGVSIDWLNDGVGNPPVHRGTRELASPYNISRIYPTQEALPPAQSETPTGYVRFEHSRLNSPEGGQLMDIEFPEIMHAMEVRDEEAFSMAGKKQNGAIKISGIGSDAMIPTLSPRDVVFIDTEVNKFAGDGIYFFVYDGSLFCKRLQKVQRGSLAVISDNKSYSSWTIERDDPTPWRVVARVLSALPLQVKALA